MVQKTASIFSILDDLHVLVDIYSIRMFCSILAQQELVIKVGVIPRENLRQIHWNVFVSRKLQELMGKSYLSQLKGDKDLARKMTPNFEIGCKRIVFTNEFLPMFANYPNCHLETDGIEEITDTGIKTKDGRHVEVDLIVFATGFSIEDSICGFKAIGRNGHVLREYFDENPVAYKGITVPNFPNFFILLGPNTVLAHNSVVFMIECQVFIHIYKQPTW